MAPASPQELASSSPPAVPSPSRSLHLAALPPLYIIPTHFSNDELYNFEEKLAEHDAPITYDVKEARIFLTKILRGKRAALELRTKGLWTEPVAGHVMTTSESRSIDAFNERSSKKRRLSQVSTASESSGARAESSTSDEEALGSEVGSPLKGNPLRKSAATGLLPALDDKIIVVKVDWITQSASAGKLLPIDQFVVYTAHPISKPEETIAQQPVQTNITYIKAAPESSPSSAISKDQNSGILARAQSDATAIPDASFYNRRRRLGGDRTDLKLKQTGPPRLHRTTTSEFEGAGDVEIPEPPAWVKKHEAYACRRSTPPNPPNASFIAELQKIKQARILTLDEVGERAYATSIASISAYPYQISHPGEILRLPGCDTRIASLWTEWRESGDIDEERYIPAAKDLEKDEHLKILKHFYDIWGVGAETARKFYFTKGWKDIDDLIEYGWNELTRVQQIGVKYYDEFQIGIPRAEVERINSVVLDHARKCRDLPQSLYDTKDDFVSVIVGGYRRGKQESGDVDLIISHRSEQMTQDLVIDVIQNLEQSGWITHTLTLHTTTSDRDQQTLPYRGAGHGHGFDSLDKGLCVWQDPVFSHPTTGKRTSTLEEREKGEDGVKNPNIHRRVDIIISPWRTVGCAVLGWSGATTFQRDIRRWAKKKNFWKFDSSGIRDRATGKVIDLEGNGETWEEREKLVMEGLGIGWRPPSERWTG